MKFYFEISMDCLSWLVVVVKLVSHFFVAVFCGQSSKEWQVFFTCRSAGFSPQLGWLAPVLCSRVTFTPKLTEAGWSHSLWRPCSCWREIRKGGSTEGCYVTSKSRTRPNKARSWSVLFCFTKTVTKSCLWIIFIVSTTNVFSDKKVPFAAQQTRPAKKNYKSRAKFTCDK